VTLGSHQQTVGKSQTHLTPRWIIDALGPFDLDPCAADPRPWDCATVNWSEADDGLSRQWIGRVWMNPPFDRRHILRWVDRLAEHGNGIALVHARTETEWFRRFWRDADGILFLRKRLVFLDQSGRPGKTARGEVANSGAPLALVAFGAANAKVLRSGCVPGWMVDQWVEAA
jgi:hypothetical protein